jgi:hypothetical protein
LPHTSKDETENMMQNIFAEMPLFLSKSGRHGWLVGWTVVYHIKQMQNLEVAARGRQKGTLVFNPRT